MTVGHGVTDAEAATLMGTTNLATGAAFGFDTSAADRTFSGQIQTLIGSSRPFI